VARRRQRSASVDRRRFAQDGPQWAQRAIVFTSGNSGDARTWEIDRCCTAGKQILALTHNQSRTGAVVSPDGARILYLTDGDGFAALATMALDAAISASSTTAAATSRRLLTARTDASSSSRRTSARGQLYLLTADASTGAADDGRRRRRGVVSGLKAADNEK